MCPIDGGAGESALRLVTYDSPWAEHNAVCRVDRRLARELAHVQSFGWRPDRAARHPDWEAWLWGAGPVGGAIFLLGTWSRADEWTLERVWVHPRFRRCGLLSAAWPVWLNRYGPFAAFSPSDALRTFLARHGWSPPPYGTTWRPPEHSPVAPGAR